MLGIRSTLSPVRLMLLLAAQGALSPFAGAASSFSEARWIITPANVSTLMGLDAQDARRLFDSPLANLQGNPKPDIPTGWKSTAQGHYTSYDALVRDLNSGAITPSSVPYLIYDIEKWAKSPKAEQHAPGDAMERFTRLAHAHGFITNMAPDQNLASPVVGNTSYQGGESENWQSFLRLGLAADAARTGTEYVHIMAQPFESRWGRTPERTYVGGEADFVNFVTQAALQARAVNPRVLLTCGLSGNRRYRPNARILFQESVDVLGIVNGYWLNIWGNPMGAEYLRLVSGPLPAARTSVLFASAGTGLASAQPSAAAPSELSLATHGATRTFTTSQTYPAGTVIPAGAWEFQYWTDQGTGSARLGLEFGYRDASGGLHPIIPASAGWSPDVVPSALGRASAQGAFTTKDAVRLPPGGPYRLYWTVTVLEPGSFRLLYGSASAPTDLATPFLQPLQRQRNPDGAKS